MTYVEATALKVSCPQGQMMCQGEITGREGWREVGVRDMLNIWRKTLQATTRGGGEKKDDTYRNQFPLTIHLDIILGILEAGMPNWRFRR